MAQITINEALTWLKTLKKRHEGRTVSWVWFSAHDKPKENPTRLGNGPSLMVRGLW